MTDRVPILAGGEDLAEREQRFAIHPGDPIPLAPDYRVDEVLNLYLCRSSFSRLEHEPKRNYTGDDGGLGQAHTRGSTARIQQGCTSALPVCVVCSPRP
ncbi:hypothetical protein [Streptomyces sp. ODS28]|uniref:hypothetical protein n=1 Tax=Streptomyces sp. ODS28 TaxID=3136688 RepID=UPI0031E62DBC